jgi:hypothetical protein
MSALGPQRGIVLEISLSLARVFDRHFPLEARIAREAARRVVNCFRIQGGSDQRLVGDIFRTRKKHFHSAVEGVLFR